MKHNGNRTTTHIKYKNLKSDANFCTKNRMPFPGREFLKKRNKWRRFCFCFEKLTKGQVGSGQAIQQTSGTITNKCYKTRPLKTCRIRRTKHVQWLSENSVNPNKPSSTFFFNADQHASSLYRSPCLCYWGIQRPHQRGDLLWCAWAQSESLKISSLIRYLDNKILVNPVPRIVQKEFWCWTKNHV